MKRVLMCVLAVLAIGGVLGAEGVNVERIGGEWEIYYTSKSSWGGIESWHYRPIERNGIYASVNIVECSSGKSLNSLYEEYADPLYDMGQVFVSWVEDPLNMWFLGDPLSGTASGIGFKRVDGKVYRVHIGISKFDSDASFYDVYGTILECLGAAGIVDSDIAGWFCMTLYSFDIGLLESLALD